VSRFSPPSPHVTITTKFEVHTTIYYVVLAFLLLKRCDLVTLTFDLLTVNSDHEWQVMLLSHPPRLKTLMPVRSWVMRSSICYHWQCVCSHCECRVCERIVPFVLATFLLLLHRNSCIGASDKNSNTAFDSLIPISLYRAILRRFKDVDFTWFFHRVSWKSATFLFPVNLAYWPRKCRTFRPQRDNCHQVWSWHDHLLPSSSFFLLLKRYVTLWPWPLIFWPWTAVRQDWKLLCLSVLELWGPLFVTTDNAFAVTASAA